MMLKGKSSQEVSSDNTERYSTASEYYSQYNELFLEDFQELCSQHKRVVSAHDQEKSSSGSCSCENCYNYSVNCYKQRKQYNLFKSGINDPKYNVYHSTPDFYVSNFNADVAASNSYAEVHSEMMSQGLGVPIINEAFKHYSSQSSEPVSKQKERSEKEILHGEDLRTEVYPKESTSSAKDVTPDPKMTTSSGSGSCQPATNTEAVSTPPVGDQSNTEPTDTANATVKKNARKRSISSDHSSDEGFSKMETIQNKRTRKHFTREEKEAILNYIIRKRAFTRLKSDALYIEIEKKKICPNRTYQSMKNHFLRTILRELDSYDFLDKDTKFNLLNGGNRIYIYNGENIDQEELKQRKGGKRQLFNPKESPLTSLDQSETNESRVGEEMPEEGLERSEGGPCEIDETVESEKQRSTSSGKSRRKYTGSSTLRAKIKKGLMATHLQFTGDGDDMSAENPELNCSSIPKGFIPSLERSMLGNHFLSPVQEDYYTESEMALSDGRTPPASIAESTPLDARELAERAEKNLPDYSSEPSTSGESLRQVNENLENFEGNSPKISKHQYNGAIRNPLYKNYVLSKGLTGDGSRQRKENTILAHQALLNSQVALRRDPASFLQFDTDNNNYASTKHCKGCNCWSFLGGSGGAVKEITVHDPLSVSVEKGSVTIRIKESSETEIRTSLLPEGVGSRSVFPSQSFRPTMNDSYNSRIVMLNSSMSSEERSLVARGPLGLLRSDRLSPDTIHPESPTTNYFSDDDSHFPDYVNKHTKTRFSRKEKELILKYIISQKAYHRLKSDALYKEMERKKICPIRTYQSMKNNFLKCILKELHTYSFVTETIRRKLLGQTFEYEN